ncbi:hypothetical protein I4U23_020430 [Adineta vaga]|nr:hypothetical protein I4U23_020430 [Adineta vaga]
MTTIFNRNPGGFRGYSNEQKTLRAKLDHLIKWTRDLKSNILKQSCKALQTNNSNSSNVNRQIVDQIHDDLDEYKRKFDRELGRIHDICDALANNSTTNDKEENLRNDILEALRRSPTYSSLERHIDDDSTRSHIRVKLRENCHPGQNRIPRIPSLSTDKIKRKASQPIALDIIDTTRIPGAKRRPQNNPFKRSRSYTNIEHTETQLGMDYIEEDENDLSWKPFGPKRSVSQVNVSSTNQEQSNDEQITISTEKPIRAAVNNDSSDEEFDIAWERRAKLKARKEAATTVPTETPSKRTVRFSPSTHEPVECINLDLDETTQDGISQIKDQNNNHNKQQTDIVHIDDDEETIIPTRSLSSLSQQMNIQNDDSFIIDDSDDDDDEIIPLSDDDIPKTSKITRRKTPWTTSEIQVSNGNSQSQSLHNPYRVGIADPSIRSVFLPPPNSQIMAATSSGNRRAQGVNRKSTSTKRGTSSK